eukprot:UN02068
MKRHFEFSTDSFQIIIDEQYVKTLANETEVDTKLKNYYKDKQAKQGISMVEETDEDYKCGVEIDFSDSENDEIKITNAVNNLPWFLPRVKVECLYNDFKLALYHLTNFKCTIFYPEGIRGGGLLKYCYLRSIGFVDDEYPIDAEHSLKQLQCSMVCRFLITCNDPESQWAAISKYLQTHFPTNYKSRVRYIHTVRSVIMDCSAGTDLQLVRNLLVVTARILEYYTTINESNVYSRMNPQFGGMPKNMYNVNVQHQPWGIMYTQNTTANAEGQRAYSVAQNSLSRSSRTPSQGRLTPPRTTTTGTHNSISPNRLSQNNSYTTVNNQTQNIKQHNGTYNLHVNIIKTHTVI